MRARLVEPDLRRHGRVLGPDHVVANLGDRDDAYWGWSGPNTVDGGAGNDNPITGAGGDDSLHGGIGSDELEGWDGDDLLDGGPGDDYLEGIAYVEEGMTHGTDTYVGGGGYDTVTYEGRTEDLSLSPDGVANDGAAGERDDIGTDVMAVGGGHGADTMTGNGARNVFGGGEGDDVLTGAGGDDHLVGALGRRQADRRRRAGPARRRVRRRHARRRRRRRPLLRRLRERLHRLLLPQRPRRHPCPGRRARGDQLRPGHRHARGRPDRRDLRLGHARRPVRGPHRHPHRRRPERRAGRRGGFRVAGAKVDRRGRIVVRFTAPGPGRATVRASARLSRSIRMTVGTASRTVSRAGKATLTVTPSRAAKRALRSRARLTTTLKIAFKPAGGGAVSRQVRRVTLRRG